MSTPKTLTTVSIENLAGMESYYLANLQQIQQRPALERALIKPGDRFDIPGWCHVCARDSVFETDYLYSGERYEDGTPIPNWRERLVCKTCQLNNRIRASIHFLQTRLPCDTTSSIYISEQTTPLYHYLKKHYPNLVGSEYFGTTVPYGKNDSKTGLRNESITKLSFRDESFDFVLSFDVFEHVPEYTKALSECSRVLKPGGFLLFTVPFALNRQDNLVRASMDEDGNITHYLEPEYHGDPVNAQGCLSFYTFGWQLMKDITDHGFDSVKAHLYWSPEFGYLGGMQALLLASK